MISDNLKYDTASFSTFTFQNILHIFNPFADDMVVCRFPFHSSEPSVWSISPSSITSVVIYFSMTGYYIVIMSYPLIYSGAAVRLFNCWVILPWWRPWLVSSASRLSNLFYYFLLPYSWVILNLQYIPAAGWRLWVATSLSILLRHLPSCCSWLCFNLIVRFYFTLACSRNSAFTSHHVIYIKIESGCKNKFQLWEVK